MSLSFRSFSVSALAVSLSLIAVATFAQQPRGITPEDYPGGPLAGIDLQRRLESQAYVLGGVIMEIANSCRRHS